MALNYQPAKLKFRRIPVTKLRLKRVLPACVLGLFLSTSAEAAFVIDDFNVDPDSDSIVRDDFAGAGTVTGASIIDGSNIVMDGFAGWTRSLAANLSTGDNMDTIVCGNCQAGHVNMSSNSIGIGTFRYTGPAIDLSSYTHLVFDWSSDLSGAAVDIFFNGTSAAVSSWSGLVGGTGMTTQTPMAIAWGNTAVFQIDFVVTAGVVGLDSNIDNIQAVVPVPAAVWLFGSGLLGLVGIARRKKTA